MTQDHLAAAKAGMRRSARAHRQTASLASPGAARIAGAHAFEEIARKPGITAVAGYLAHMDEIDPMPLMHLLHGHGLTVCLPCVVEPDTPLRFRRWHPGARLVRGAYGIMIPEDESEVDPDLLVAPLLAFDPEGYRLGYGGGYYDRTIAERRARGPLHCMGLAFAAQEVEAVPHNALDMPLDCVVTERGVLRIAA